MLNKWHFSDSPSTAVLTTKNILNRKTDILLIFHDEEDGMWQFLDGSTCTEETAAIAALNEIVSMDNSVTAIADLPLGYMAYRDTKTNAWSIKKI